MPIQQKLIDKCMKDQKGHIALVQAPNLPLVVWLVARLLTWPLSGLAQKTAQVVAFGALFTWAWLELFQGVNYARRLLGLVVLGLLVVSATKHGVF